MPDTPIFDSEYYQPSKTELHSLPVSSPPETQSVFDAQIQDSSTTEATVSQNSSSVQEKNFDIVVENDPSDVLRIVDTGRPYRKIREWTIING
jgi:hypothetical protein